MKPFSASSTAMPAVQRHIHEFDPHGGFPDWWVALHSASHKEVVFLSKDWLETWLTTYGTNFQGHWIWWTSDGRVVAGCLILIKRVRLGALFVRKIFLNASGPTLFRSPLAECNDILCLSGFEDAIAHDFNQLLTQMKWDRFSLTACATDGVIGRVLKLTPQSNILFEHKAAPYINFLVWPNEPFEKRLSGSTRSQIRRCSRIYETENGPISISAAPNLETALQYFELMAVMHNSRWAAKGVSGSFSNDLAISFHRNLIKRVWESGMVDILCVRAGDMTIGVLYNFIGQDKVYFFQSGFSYQPSNKLKPGLLTHYMAIENYRLRGMREYDFLAGDSRFKRTLATHERCLLWGSIYNKTCIGRLHLWTHQFKAFVHHQRTKIQNIAHNTTILSNVFVSLFSLPDYTINETWFAQLLPTLI